MEADSPGIANRSVRKVLSWMGIALGSIAVLLGIEVFLAFTRDYLPTSPVLELGGTFGPPDGRPLTFVVLGDSTAAGLGAGSAEHAYATVLSERLGERGWKVDLLAHGESGARVRDVLIEQTPIAETVEADLVFVGIGANDATHFTSLDSIRENMVMTASTATRRDFSSIKPSVELVPRQCSGARHTESG